MYEHEPVTFRSIIKISIIAIGLVLMVFYILFQARYLIMGPQITLHDVPEIRQNQRQIELTGAAYNISRLWLNDRPIYTDAQGNFKEALVLENGYTVATLRAEDRYGRETTVTQAFVYAPMNFVSSI
ncbi:MAG: hypothetical protein KC877_01705 [Candidatus Kaiserbacteria bacterium]|nr:hypothetical protein [Candidatus Kaiserbacteria bacterium]MCB9816358.1 hypothetical protein [Candidatus Nomurabacteria bacterium]